MLNVALNVSRYKKRLLEKGEELSSNIKRLEYEARSVGIAEVRDSTDQATASQWSSESLEEGALASQTLVQVQDALLRMEHEAYGTCIACGKQVEASRLDAVPWSAYCLEDQQKLDQAARSNSN